MAQTYRSNPISVLLQNRGTTREAGIYSCCSANPFVIRAALRRAAQTGTVALVEATANQVNQYGGYTGMTPEDFHRYLYKIAAEEGFPPECLLCGGDHLGPLSWQHLPEREAMDEAKKLVRAYVLAGFSKIHIDATMRVADDDPNVRLADETIARRGAALCLQAETAFAEYHASHPDAPAPIYVIGSEVPIPGGAQENEDTVSVTSACDLAASVDAFHAAFCRAGLQDAWQRVVAVVVQPGVEFSDASVVCYDRAAAAQLTESLSRYPQLVFEGHSTDYQPKQCLRKMVEDGIAILKVGPALTFGLREGLFALEKIERELLRLREFVASNFSAVLDQVMLENRKNWEKYYHGDFTEQRFARAFSYSDRARYYLTDARVTAAVEQLLGNLDRIGIPPALLSQYLHTQYLRVRDGQLRPCAADILIDHIGDFIDDYLYAVLR